MFRSLFSSRHNDRPCKCAQLCRVLDRVFADILPLMSAGKTTAQLDEAAAESIAANHCVAEFKRNPGNDFQNAITTSVNDQVVNGIPGPRVLQAGDLLSLQVGIEQKGIYALQGWTFHLEPEDPQNVRLWLAGHEALRNAINVIRSRARVRDVSTAIQDTLEQAGFQPGREFVGHGIEDEPHVEPTIPCFVSQRAQPGSHDPALKTDQLLSINVFAHAGSHRTKTLADQWTVISHDGTHSVHFSHIVAVKKHGCEVLTAGRSMRSDAGA